MSRRCILIRWRCCQRSKRHTPSLGNASARAWRATHPTRRNEAFTFANFKEILPDPPSPYLTSLIIANSSATNITVDIRDGSAGSVLATFPVPAGGGCIHAQDVADLRKVAEALRWHSGDEARGVLAKMYELAPVRDNRLGKWEEHPGEFGFASRNM